MCAISVTISKIFAKERKYQMLNLERLESSMQWSLYVIDSQTVTDKENITIAHVESRIWTLNWYIYIWLGRIIKVKVKVMHILTANIMQTVENRENIITDTIANK